MIPLAELITALKVKIEEMKTKVIEKEEELAALFKRTLKEESEFATETKKMVQQLRRTRDEQVSEMSHL